LHSYSNIRKPTLDNNGLKHWLKFANRWSDGAHEFAHPILDSQTNLKVLLASKVICVLFEGNEYIVCAVILGTDSRNPSFAGQSPKMTRARKMVVLALGAISTPLILERSGIGSAKHLSNLGVSILSDLPGVVPIIRLLLLLLHVWSLVVQMTRASDCS